MEIIIPPCLIAVREIRWHMENNHSVRESLRLYTQVAGDEFALVLRDWADRRQNGEMSNPGKSAPQRALFSLLERGLAGQPILEALTALESEIQRSALLELDLHLARLPFLSMIPLFLFQFPAFLLLLLGPLLTSLIEQMGSP